MKLLCRINREGEHWYALPLPPKVKYWTRHWNTLLKGKLSDSFTNNNYVGNTKVSVSIKKT